jgi:hypothetical protein
MSEQPLATKKTEIRIQIVVAVPSDRESEEKK